jgi:hypothetical protein
MTDTFDTAPGQDTPPRKLGAHGRDLWDRIQAEYDVHDSAGREMPEQACAAADRAEALATEIEFAGLTNAEGKANPLIRVELACRVFVCRILQRLGLDVEPLKPIGRQPGAPQWSGHQKRKPWEI